MLLARNCALATSAHTIVRHRKRSGHGQARMVFPRCRHAQPRDRPRHGVADPRLHPRQRRQRRDAQVLRPRFQLVAGRPVAPVCRGLPLRRRLRAAGRRACARRRAVTALRSAPAGLAGPRSCCCCVVLPVCVLLVGLGGWLALRSWQHRRNVLAPERSPALAGARVHSAGLRRCWACRRCPRSIKRAGFLLGRRDKPSLVEADLPEFFGDPATRKAPP